MIDCELPTLKTLNFTQIAFSLLMSSLKNWITRSLTLLHSTFVFFWFVFLNFCRRVNSVSTPTFLNLSYYV